MKEKMTINEAKIRIEDLCEERDDCYFKLEDIWAGCVRDERLSVAEEVFYAILNQADILNDTLRSTENRLEEVLKETNVKIDSNQMSMWEVIKWQSQLEKEKSIMKKMIGKAEKTNVLVDTDDMELVRSRVNNINKVTRTLQLAIDEAMQILIEIDMHGDWERLNEESPKLINSEMGKGENLEKDKKEIKSSC